MFDTAWIKSQLRNSHDLLCWSIEQIPVTRHAQTPPTNISEWPAQLHVYHLYVYESGVLATKGLWLPGAEPLTDAQTEAATRLWMEQEKDWQKQDMSHWLARLGEIREQTIALMDEVPGDGWQQKQQTFWGRRTLAWLYIKTLQHGLEHTNTLMQMNVFWKPENN